MALRFTIENMTSLPDGGPVSFAVTGRRSADIGRDQHLDWTLPDPSRFISGKHCEVHFRDNGYWLHDVSTNGTFLNGSEQRMRSPHLLKTGDRLIIGHYIVVVSIDAEAGVASMPPTGAGVTPPPQPAAYGELWNFNEAAPPPIDRQQMVTPGEAARPVSPDFLDWAAAVPEVEAGPSRPRSLVRAPAVNPDDDWAGSPPSRPPPPPPPPTATPRRPVWRDDDTGASPNPFTAAPPAPAPAESNPQPASAPAPAPASSVAKPAGAPGVAVEGHEFGRRVARAAGLPDDFFAGKDAEQLADQFGELMRISVGNLMALLQARNEAKRLTRSTSHTMIQATENNPLKFSPTPEDAMRILFGPKTHSYLDARRAFEQGFHDLKSHQVKTYAAMQHAVSMMIAHVDPAAVIKDAEGQEGILDRLQSRKARLWDAFVARWKASYGREKGAAVEAFMLHFADYYDQDDRMSSR